MSGYQSAKGGGLNKCAVLFARRLGQIAIQKLFKYRYLTVRGAACCSLQGAQCL